jgi:hypothetical protein
MSIATRQITAFLDGEDSPTISNPIHSTGVAQEYGFKAALVGGVTVYGWCAPAIIEALGERWLEDGWADISFRRPTYPGDAMTATVQPTGDTWSLEMTNGDRDVCIRGTLGLGAAPFAGEFVMPELRDAGPGVEPRPQLTLESARTGVDLVAMFVPFTAEDARAYARDLQQDERDLWNGGRPRLHPGWVAARMTPLLKHNYWYSPAIHARSRIQHTGRGFAETGVTVAGHLLRVYEEKGHHYAEVDGVILGDDGGEIARIRHTTIFRPRKVG